MHKPDSPGGPNQNRWLKEERRAGVPDASSKQQKNENFNSVQKLDSFLQCAFCYKFSQMIFLSKWLYVRILHCQTKLILIRIVYSVFSNDLENMHKKGIEMYFTHCIMMFNGDRLLSTVRHWMIRSFEQTIF